MSSCVFLHVFTGSKEQQRTRSDLCNSSCAGVVNVFGFVPEQIAAEDYTEHEDEHAYAQYNDVHVERQTVDVFL